MVMIGCAFANRTSPNTDSSQILSGIAALFLIVYIGFRLSPVWIGGGGGRRSISARSDLIWDSIALPSPFAHTFAGTLPSRRSRHLGAFHRVSLTIDLRLPTKRRE